MRRASSRGVVVREDGRRAPLTERGSLTSWIEKEKRGRLMSLRAWREPGREWIEAVIRFESSHGLRRKRLSHDVLPL
jgi:hypothetical protein